MQSAAGNTVKNGRNSGRGLAVLVIAGILAVFIVSVAMAQTAAPAAVKPINLTATSAGVSGAGETIDFFIDRWSTDAERDKVAAAWNVAPPAPAPAPSAAPALPGAPAAANAGGGGGRGGGGRGGGGGGRGGGGAGGGAAAAAPKSPENSLSGTMKDLPSVGYFWTSEVGGYLIRYAYRIPLPDGGSRIILLTDKRLGTAKNKWDLAPPLTANKYEFTLIELRLPAKGEGEGKASLTGSIAVDPTIKSLALAGTDTLPVVMKGVKLK